MDDAGRILVGLLIAVCMLTAYVMIEQWMYKEQMAVAETGQIGYGMLQDHVLAAFGSPDDVTVSGWGPFEKTTWIYKNPFRSVTFDQERKVIDWSPKGHWAPQLH